MTSAPIESDVGFALGAALSMLFRAKPRLARLVSILAPTTPQFLGTQTPPISLQFSAPYLPICWKYRMQSEAIVSSKGQVTLPAAMRKILGIVAGSHIHFELRGNELVIKPEPPMSAYRGLLKRYKLDPADLAIPKEQDREIL